MSIETPKSLAQAPIGARREPGAWRRFWAWLAAVEAAMDTSCDDIQDRRILALERKVAMLAERVPAASGCRLEDETL